MKLPTHKKFLSATAAASVLLLTAACGGSEEPADATPTTSETTSASTDGSSASSFKDGDYEADATYSNPAGESKVSVELTLTDGKISAIEVTPGATNGTSKGFQAKFAGGIADEVVGKSLDELNVSKVSGSSLTSVGFNKAIDQIKADATA